MASELDHLSLGPLHCRSALHINVSPVGTVALETPDLPPKTLSPFPTPVFVTDEFSKHLNITHIVLQQTACLFESLFWQVNGWLSERA